MCGWIVLRFPCRDNNQEHHYFRRIHLYCRKAGERGLKVCDGSDEGVPDWQKTFVLKAPDTPGFEMCPLCWLYKRHQLVDLAGFSFIPSVFVHRARWMEFEAGFQLHYLNTYAMPENAEKMNLFPREEDPIKRVQCLLASEDRTDLTQNLNQMQWSLGSDES